MSVCVTFVVSYPWVLRQLLDVKTILRDCDKARAVSHVEIPNRVKIVACLHVPRA
jgi:hypothetical protein